ncbi:MAG: helix-hairpin-helix domain-containing protein [candidate division WOR-3 bacterium]
MSLLLFFLLLPHSGNKADFAVVRVIWTSDLHGQLLPTPDFASGGLPRRKLGGYNRLARLIQEERTQATLILDNGDFAFGSPEGDSSQGRVMIGLFNRLGYDAVVLGARDFKDGLVNIELLARAAGFPILADPMLNVLLNRQSPIFRPYIVKDVRGVKVGVIGLMDKEITSLNQKRFVAGVVVDEPLKQVQKLLPAVKAESAEVILVLGHIGSGEGRVIAESVPEVNLIICKGEGERVESQLPKSGKAAVVVGGVYGQRVGVADILFHKTERRVYAVEAQVLNVLPEDEPDSVLKALLVKGYDTIVAFADEEFFPDEAGKLKLALVICEGLRQETGADIAILPLSVVEAGLTKGALTRRDLFNSVPYQERLRLIYLPESLLAMALVPAEMDKGFPCPAVAGADLFITGDTLLWPRLFEVVRFRLRERKRGFYRVVTTENWLERTGLEVSGRALPDNLTRFWLNYAEKEKRVGSVPQPKLYLATPGLLPKEAPGLININTATLELLCQLPGIGPKTAQRIIDYRKTQGRFNSIEEIMNVRGIGPKRFEQIKNLITVR